MSHPHPSVCGTVFTLLLLAGGRLKRSRTSPNDCGTPARPPGFPAPFPPCFDRTDSQIGHYSLPIRGVASGPSHRPLFWVTFHNLLRQWGSPELAERAAHDLFFNVRSLSPVMSRLRLFGAFSGCLPSENSDPSFQGDGELQDEEALAFYLRAVATFHRVRDDLVAANEEKNTNGGGDGNTPGGNGSQRFLYCSVFTFCVTCMFLVFLLTVSANKPRAVY